MKKVKRFLIGNIKTVIAFILGGIVFGTIGVYAATTLLSQSVYYDNTTSGASSTNVQDALDELYQKAETSQEMSSVLEFIEDSIDLDTIQFNTAQTVLASHKGVCIKRNGRLNCFKTDDFDYEKEHIQQVFSDVSCDVVTTGLFPLRHVECDASDFNCRVTPTSGIQCSDATDSSNCYVSFHGDVECN